LRVPFVALAPKPIDSLSWRGGFGHDAFENFKQTADGEDNGRRQPKAPGSVNPTKPEEQFANWKHEKKSKREVGHTVVMVSGKTEKTFRPDAKRHLCVGVMRADNVQNNESCEEEIGCLGELETPAREGQEGDEENEQRVFEKPRLSIKWSNRSHHPGQGTDGG
jgi:hypothetical protein